MPNGVGQGIATGLTNALSLALQSKGFDIREERAQALADIGERRLDISERELALKEGEFRPSIPQQQQEFEAEQETGRIKREQDKLELNQALEQEARTKNFLSVQGHLDQRVGDARTPAQEEAFGIFLDAMLPGRSRNGLYSEADVDEAFKSAMDPDNPAPGGAELIKKYFNAGSSQSDNMVEVQKKELEKMVEKNPLLGTNPEALKADEKAAVLAQSIDELTQTSNQFKSQAAETDEFIIQSKERQKAKQEELNRQRAEAIETIQRAREGGQSDLSSRNAGIRFAEARKEAREQAKEQGITDLSEIENLAGNLFAADLMELTLAQKTDPFKKAFDTSAGRIAGTRKEQFEDEIIAANESDRTIKRGRELLDKGIFSGPLANIKTGFNKYLSEFGFSITGSAVADTETFAINMAQDVLSLLKTRVLGSGTAVSDEDRKFALRIAAADITLDEGSIRQLLDINSRINTERRLRANRELGELQLQREASDPFAGTPSSAERREGGGMTADEFLKLKARQ